MHTLTHPQTYTHTPHVYTHASTHKLTQTYILTQTHTCMCIHTLHIHVYIYSLTEKYTYTYRSSHLNKTLHTHVFIHTCLHTCPHMCTNKYTCAYLHIFMHTNTHMLLLMYMQTTFMFTHVRVHTNDSCMPKRHRNQCLELPMIKVQIIWTIKTVVIVMKQVWNKYSWNYNSFNNFYQILKIGENLGSLCRRTSNNFCTEVRKRKRNRIALGWEQFSSQRAWGEGGKKIEHCAGIILTNPISLPVSTTLSHLKWQP